MSAIDPMSHELTLPYAAPPEGLTWPKPTAATIADYIKKYEAYDAALMTLTESEAALETAIADDTKALIDAVASDSPDPGTPNEAKARRTLEYDSERLRQTYRAASTAQTVMFKQIQADPGDVVKQAAHIEREHVARLEAAHVEAAAIVNKANTAFSGFGTTMNGLEAVGLDPLPAFKFSTPLYADGLTPPTLNSMGLANALHRLELIDPTETESLNEIMEPTA